MASQTSAAASTSAASDSVRPVPVPVQAFSSSFWTPDYLQGISVLFNKLEQGVSENTQVVDFITARISQESAFATNIQKASKDISTSKPATHGFNRDEGASLKQAFQSFLDESAFQGNEHGNIAAALERTVRGPFSQYALAHKTRIAQSRALLVSMSEDYKKSVANVAKAQQVYFTKARQLEDFSDPTISSSVPRIVTSPSSSSPQTSIALTLNTPDSPKRQVLAATSRPVSIPAPAAAAAAPVPPVVPQNIVIGSLSFTPAQFATLLQSMLSTIPQKTLKLPILGSYEHASTGEDIVVYIRKYLTIRSLGDAEKFGQALVDNGYLRLVAAVGSKFSGTESAHFQWLPKAFHYDPEAQLKEAAEAQAAAAAAAAKTEEVKTPSEPSTPAAAALSKLSKVGGYFSNLLNEEDDESGLTPRETQMNKLQREIADNDLRYQDLVRALDAQRVRLEQKMFETFNFVQQCERDRLIAVKRVMLDFVQATSKADDTLKESRARMLMHQECVDPIKDLNYLIERYKTGTYAPSPVVYDSFFNTAAKIQTFGVDLKHSAFMLPAFLDFMANSDAPEAAKTEVDNTDTQSVGSVASDKTTEFPSSKPLLSLATSASAIAKALKFKYKGISEEKRVLLTGLWSAPQASSLQIQTLRSQINTGKEFPAFDVLCIVPMPVVVSVLKEFLLELPDSIVSSTVYDIIKTTYAKTTTQPAAPMDEQAALEDQRLKLNQRIERIVGLLSHLPQVNIDGLQTLITHFAEITGLPEHGSVTDVPESVKDLSRAMAPYILKPRTTTALTMTDKHPVLFLQDLIVHREQVFTEVQRRMSLAQEARTRSRSASSSEANRRFQIEARNREIAAAAIQAASGLNGGAKSSTTTSTTTGTAAADVNIAVSPAPTQSGSGSAMRPLTLSPMASQRKNGSLTPSGGSSNDLLKVAAAGETRSHRRSLSTSSRPPLSMFLSPEPVRRAE